jgi:predicted ester cyclase
MSTAENKVLYRRFIEEGFNQGLLATLDEVLAAGYVDYDAPPGTPAGPDGIKQIVSLFRAAFPDLHIDIEEQVAEGDVVCSRLRTTGTHQGELFGMPANGTRITMTGLTMVRVVKGQLVEGWVKNDMLGLLQQIGGAPLASQSA